jgi:hypothetical protein
VKEVIQEMIKLTSRSKQRKLQFQKRQPLSYSIFYDNTAKKRRQTKSAKGKRRKCANADNSADTSFLGDKCTNAFLLHEVSTPRSPEIKRERLRTNDSKKRRADFFRKKKQNKFYRNLKRRKAKTQLQSFIVEEPSAAIFPG